MMCVGAWGMNCQVSKHFSNSTWLKKLWSCKRWISTASKVGQIWELPTFGQKFWFYSAWKRHHFLVFPVSWNSCWKESLQIPTHGISAVKHDPWQLLAEIGVVLVMLSTARLLDSSCGFYSRVRFTPCPLAFWGLGGWDRSALGAALCFSSCRAPAPAGARACRGRMPGGPWNPAPWLIQDADPRVPARPDEAKSCWGVHNRLWLVQWLIDTPRVTDAQTHHYL